MKYARIRGVSSARLKALTATTRKNLKAAGLIGVKAKDMTPAQTDAWYAATWEKADVLRRAAQKTAARVGLENLNARENNALRPEPKPR